MINRDIHISRLPEDRWKECRDLRLEALQNDPTAFGSSYEEESLLSEMDWKERINNALFALVNDIPVGMVVIIQHSNKKAQHIASIFGVYVQEEFRGNGIGQLLIEHAIGVLKALKQISKIKLTVNPKQEAAVQLYKKLGFKVVGTLLNETYYDEVYYDEMILELHLS